MLHATVEAGPNLKGEEKKALQTPMNTLEKGPDSLWVSRSGHLMSSSGFFPASFRGQEKEQRTEQADQINFLQRTMQVEWVKAASSQGSEEIPTVWPSHTTLCHPFFKD